MLSGPFVVHVGVLSRLGSFVHESDLCLGKIVFLVARRAGLYSFVWSVRFSSIVEALICPDLLQDSVILGGHSR